MHCSIRKHFNEVKASFRKHAHCKSGNVVLHFLSALLDTDDVFRVGVVVYGNNPDVLDIFRQIYCECIAHGCQSRFTCAYCVRG